MIRRGAFAASLLTAVGLIFAAAAPASAAVPFTGSCSFSGDIEPDPGITVLPHEGAKASFHATGSCSGQINGGPQESASLELGFDQIPTLLDTCELGPDLELPVEIKISGADSGRVLSSRVTIDLVRVAVLGPMLIRPDWGGLWVGLATFAPPDPVGGLADCLGKGVSKATLAGNFLALPPLTGG